MPKLSSVFLLLAFLWVFFIIFSNYFFFQQNIQVNTDHARTFEELEKSKDRLLREIDDLRSIQQEEVNRMKQQMEENVEIIRNLDKFETKNLPSDVKRNEFDKEQKEDTITILLWDGPNWAGFGLSEDVFRMPNYLGHEVKKECPISCKFVTERSKVGEVDAVLFEGTNVGFDKNWMNQNQPLRFPQKRFWQKWINFGYETPDYFPMQNYSIWKNNMDIQMTYQQKDDEEHVPITFTCLWGGGEISDFLREPPLKTEKQPIVFVASNCNRGGASARTAYVKELMQHIGVDSYGGCLHNRDPPTQHKSKMFVDPFGSSMSSKIELFKKYKFALAFENNNVTDYITEKACTVWQSGTVPIFMGSETIDDWAPGKKSFIKTSDFSSPKKLAEYLHYLINNPSEYQSYFDWKKHPLSPKFVDKVNKCVFYNSDCRLCQKLSSFRKILPRPSLKKKNYALALDGAGSCVINSFSNELFTKQYSIAAWIFANRFEDLRIVDKNIPGTFRGFNFDAIRVNDRDMTKAQLRLCSGDGCALSSTFLERNMWYHVALVFSQSDGFIKLYINGKEDVSYPNGNPTNENNLPLKIGGSSKNQHGWDGFIDDVAIFDRVITQTEIQKMMFSELTSATEGLIGYWNFNDIHQICQDSSRYRHESVVDGGVSFSYAETKPLPISWDQSQDQQLRNLLHPDY